jgi:hypothetical protein
MYSRIFLLAAFALIASGSLAQAAGDYNLLGTGDDNSYNLNSGGQQNLNLPAFGSSVGTTKNGSSRGEHSSWSRSDSKKSEAGGKIVRSAGTVRSAGKIPTPWLIFMGTTAGLGLSIALAAIWHHRRNMRHGRRHTKTEGLMLYRRFANAPVSTTLASQLVHAENDFVEPSTIALNPEIHHELQRAA